ADPRRFEAGRASTHDHHLLRRTPRSRDDMGHRLFTTRRRVVDAQRIPALIDAIDAVSRADTGTDARFFAALDLQYDVGIGQVRARHADHVDVTRRDGVTGRRDV